MAAKKFTVKLDSGDITLEWGTFAMHRFCELCGTNGKPLPLSGLVNIYDGETFSIDHIMKMIMAAYESANEATMTDREVLKMIDEAGGLMSNDSQIVAFIKFMGSETVPDVKDSNTEEKKSQQ